MFCRRIIVGLFSCGSLLGLFSTVAIAEDAAEPAAETTPATLEQISGWLAQLDDNRFDTRENAQLQLEHAGVAAIDNVAQLAQSGSLESSTRALNILLAWSESEDHALRIAALERIVKLPQRPTEAGLAGEILADAREEAALAKIVELGGLHTSDAQIQTIVVTQNGRPYGPLQVIIGSHWKGGFEGLKYVKDVRRATTLSLHSAPLGDEVAPALLELTHLRRIELYGSKLSAETIQMLREKLPPAPQMELAVRSGARLGIHGPRNGSAVVAGIIAGSAAEKAGLRSGDIINEIDGQKIESFTALTDHIATHQPGESVMLKVTRMERVDQNPPKTEQVDVKVTFDQWGEEVKPLTFVEPAGQAIQGQFGPPIPATIRIERR